MKTNNIINKSFRWRTRNLPWYPRKGTRNDLAILFKKLKFNFGVEVGTKKGEYAKILLESNLDLCLVCVDPYKGYDGISQERQNNIKEYAKNNLKGLNVNQIYLPSLEAVHLYQNETFDFVYIDANHSFDYVIQDIIYWMPKIKKDGILAAHDYCDADVRKAVDSYTHCHNINPWYVTREHLATAFWVKK